VIFHLLYCNLLIVSYIVYRISCINDLVHERATLIVCNFHHLLSLLRLHLIQSAKDLFEGEACSTKSTQRSINSGTMNNFHCGSRSICMKVYIETAIVVYATMINPRSSGNCPHRQVCAIECLTPSRQKVDLQMESRSCREVSEGSYLGIAAFKTGIVVAVRLLSTRFMV